MTRARYHRWTSEELARLKIMWITGKTGSQIAEVLGVTRHAVLAMVRRLGIKK